MSAASPLTPEWTHKTNLVRQWLQRRQLAAVALTRRHNFAWLTGGRLNYVNAASETGVATLVVTPNHVFCLCNRIESPRLAAEEVGGLGLEVRDFEWFDPADQARCWRENLPAPAATDTPPASSGVGPVDAEFNALRYTLRAEELERYRDAGRRTAAALDRVCKVFRPGLSEAHLAGLTAESAWEEGLRPWVVLIASDERITRFRHPIATDKKVRQSAMIVVCAERYGLVCSATRLVSFGRVDADLKRRHEACCRVDAAFLAGSRPGRKLREVFADGQKAYAEAGYDGEWKLHHQGGLAGYLPREVIGTPTCETILPTSAALAWNPSITGTKSEDTVLSTSAGVEIITASKDWPMIRCEIGGQVFDRPAILER